MVSWIAQYPLSEVAIKARMELRTYADLFQAKELTSSGHLDP
jgi:hypothetical protein